MHSPYEYQDIDLTTAKMSAPNTLPKSHRVYITNLVGGQALLVDQCQEDDMTSELRDAINRSLAKEALSTPSLTPSTTAASTPFSTPSSVIAEQNAAMCRWTGNTAYAPH